MEVEFKPSFQGAKPLYGSVQNNTTWAGTAWAVFGSYTIGTPRSPTVLSISAAPNGDLRAVVTLTASEGPFVGALHFSMGGADAATCHFWYTPGNSTFYLAAAIGPNSVPAGSSASIANNHWVVFGAESRVQLVDGRLVVVVAVEFRPSFQGTKPLYGAVQSNTTWALTPWEVFGSYTIGTPPSPAVLSITVSSQAGLRAVVALTASEGPFVGALHFSMGGADAATCHFWYAPGNNTFYLAAAIGPNSVLTGSPASIANNQCVIFGSGSGAQLVAGRLVVLVTLEHRLGHAAAPPHGNGTLDGQGVEAGAVDVVDLARDLLRDLDDDKEHFWVVLLNAKNHYLLAHMVSTGTQSATLTRAKCSGRRCGRAS